MCGGTRSLLNLLTYCKNEQIILNYIQMTKKCNFFTIFFFGLLLKRRRYFIFMEAFNQKSKKIRSANHIKP